MAASYFWLVVAMLIMGVFSQAKDEDPVYTKGDDVYLRCGSGCNWTKDDILMTSDVDLKLGSLWDDPRGVYKYSKGSNSEYVHVYVRRCMNCIELDPGTIAGFIVADIIMIGLIGMAVYFVSGSEMRRPGRASDKQNLIDRDTEYQVLRNRDNDQYSHLAQRPKRGGF